MTDPKFRRTQQDGIRLAHVAPLNEFIDELQEQDGRGWSPHIAPIYGGVAAEMVNILRDPGPMTNSGLGGSGLLCLENNDDTAERLANLLDGAGIGVDRTVPWNAYPWYINRKPGAAELEAAVKPLHGYLARLPRLRVVILNGGEAQDVWRRLEKRHGVPRGIEKIPTYHTSRQALIGPPEVRASREAHLRAAFARAATVLAT